MNKFLRDNHYYLLPGLISTSRAYSLSQQWTEYVNAGKALTGDPQAPNSPSAYNFLPFVRLLVEKVSLLSELAQEPLLPTYVYARTYVHGEELVRHTDRAACEVSVTLNLHKTHSWPICFARPDGAEIQVELDPGDGVMYLGCETDHWRAPFEGQELSQVFLHYVRAHGDKAWAYFDRVRDPEHV